MQEMLPIFLLTCSPHLLVGICLIAIPRMVRHSKRNRCTTQVMARCIRFDKSPDGSTSVPVYQFNYLGGTKEVKGHVYSSKHKIKEGEQLMLYINPEKPSEFYVEKEYDMIIKILTTIGSIFVIIDSFMIVGVVTVTWFVGQNGFVD